MCPPEPLPPAFPTYAHRVMLNMHDVAVPNQDNSDAADIQTAALTNQPLDGDFLAAARRHLEHTALGLSLNVPGLLIDQQREFVMQNYEYHQIFKDFAPRREDRPSRAPTAAMRDFMRKWLQSIEDFPELPKGGNPPELGRHFQNMLREHLPTKLDFQSWVGQIAFNKLAEWENLVNGNFVMWDPSFHTVTLKGYKPFLGTGGKGRPVWRYQWGVRIATNALEENLHDFIEGKIRKCEESLLSLSTQMANRLAVWIFDTHAHPMYQAHLRRRLEWRGLGPHDIYMAVVETLGHDFFELSFDDEARLQGDRWCHG